MRLADEAELEVEALLVLRLLARKGFVCVEGRGSGRLCHRSGLIGS